MNNIDKEFKPKGPRISFGWGINDADYSVFKLESGYDEDGIYWRKEVWRCPYYVKWASLLQRCFSKQALKKRPNYASCTIDERWKYFSNFKAWMETQDWEGKQLDKDLLFEGNTHYSPETCIFISRDLNLFLTDSKKSRGKYPVGVSRRSDTGKFSAQISINGRISHLGVFEDPELAHRCYLENKLKLALELCADEKDSRIKNALIARYTYNGCANMADTDNDTGKEFGL